MNKILVTGALGTIGRHLVPELRARGHDVWLLDLRHYHDDRYLRCDVASFRQLERILSVHNFDTVYHLAAEFGRWNGEDFYDTLWATNAIGTKNIIRWQERQGFQMVFFSSSEVYGDYDGLMTEEVMDQVEIKQLNDYAMTKWVGEMQCLNSAAMHGTETVRVRLFNTYGPGEFYSPYRSVNCLFCYRALLGIPYTVFRGHRRTSTYVSDAVRALANIEDNFRPGEVYNIGGGEFHDVETLSEYVLEATGADPSLVTYRDGEPFTTKVKRVDNGKATRDLDFRVTVSLREGVQRTVDWMREVYRVGESPVINTDVM
ncbi:MAG TPA: NAD(P)-dependent oxidoreductase [Anaerolineae bacterium]|nr:NAD(P)-dependent oxidoreductase [Anaerolineae bacterium]